MKTLHRLFFYGLMLLTLASCKSSQYVLDIPSENGNWQADPDSVIVLVGYISNRTPISLSHAAARQPIALDDDHGKSGLLMALALHHHAGERFELTGLGLESDKASGGLQQLDLTGMPPMNVDQPGIYYYGSLIIRDDQVSFTFDKTVQSKVVVLARKLYPDVFASLQPRNF